MKLQLLPDGESWGVFAKPVGIEPTSFTTTASGQVTVVMPLDFQWGNLESHAGQWHDDAYAISPELLPNRQIISFGLLQAEPSFPIPLQEGEETLLMSFSTEGECPDTIYLIDCNPPYLAVELDSTVCPICPEHPENPCQASPTVDCDLVGNPGNDLGILDFGQSPLQHYNYEGNYAPSAWNCHDCDGDGIPNALEEDADPCYSPDLIKTKLQYNSVEKSWSVYVTPDENVGAETVAELFNGQLSIAGSADFAPTQISSFNGGEWQTGTALLDAPENPGMSYFTFDLEPDGQPFGLEYGSEVKLFKFKNDFGGCPDSLYIVGSFRPIGIEENRLDGQATQLTGTNETAFGGIYGHEAWTCEILIGGGFPFEVGTDSLGMGDDSSKFFAAGGKTDWMTLAPNPASDFVEVKISPENTENQPIVRLLSLQGQTLHTCLADGQNTLRIDLNHLPAGLYFLSLEAGGQVVQYEKLVKK